MTQNSKRRHVTCERKTSCREIKMERKLHPKYITK